MGREEGGRFRMGNTCILWRIHFDIWQNQYNIVKLKNKTKRKKKSKKKERIKILSRETDTCNVFLTQNHYGLWVKLTFGILRSCVILLSSVELSYLLYTYIKIMFFKALNIGPIQQIINCIIIILKVKSWTSPVVQR